MSNDEQRNGGRRDSFGRYTSEQTQRQVPPRPAPGKVTLTSKLSPDREPAVQRKPAGAGEAAAPGARSLRDFTTDLWMDAAFRGTAAFSDRGEAVQALGDMEAEDSASVHQAAAAGVSGAGSALPYFDRIQAAFGGAHDLSQVRAHVGGEAAAASEHMGAQAYATGDHVAFRGQPDLHTAAHEAAHVVQQRAGVHLAGGVGQADDAYEQQADAVADAVVRGESAASLLGSSGPSRGTAAVQGAVQRQDAGATASGAQMPPATAPAQTPAPALGNSVGDGGANAPADVRVVQDRLLALGYLSQADYQAEHANAQASTGGAAQPILAANLTRTIAAIGAFCQATFGQRILTITPGTLERKLQATPALAAARVQIGAPVGRGGTNAPADVRAVQDRLLAIGLLSGANHGAEQVNAQATANVQEGTIPQTIEAIQRFHREMLGSSLAQIRAGSDVDRLNHPPQVQTVNLDISSSVGTGSVNQPASVRAVQERLRVLGYLAGADFNTEQAAPTATSPVAVAAIPRTCAAIAEFQRVVGLGRVTVTGQVAPGDVTHRLLMNPSLPVPMNAAIGGSVGRGAANAPANVRMVQQRLQELGFLSSSAYLAERPAASVANAIAVAALTQTIAAIEQFQSSVVGVPPDGRIDAGGLSARLLMDPTYGTRTGPNPNATNADAGPTVASFAHEVQQIIQAIETHEAGAGGRGERPAVLRNASGTPASFGRGQLIGGTALDTLNRYPNIASSYGLSQQDRRSLSQIAANTTTHYNAIFALVPAGGTTEANLQAAIANYVSTNGVRFHQETGLFDGDVANMFRAAQLRRHLDGHTANDTATLMNAAQHPDIAANIAALGLGAGDVRSYLTNQRRHGEHRAGFVTRALFMSEHGQKLRNAMTDNSGVGIGRLLVNDNYNLVVNRAAAQATVLTARQRAQVTMRVHNQGAGNLNGYLNNLNGTANDSYVQQAIQHWTP
jgi:Fe2+ transport system protein FeoA